jgi:hypothetical protein
MATKKHSARKPTQRAADTQGEKIYRDFLKQPAQLTKEQAEQIDRITLNPTGGYSVWRRVALASLTRPGKGLAEAVDDAENAKALADASVQIDRYVESLKSLTDMMVAASLRMTIALCKREDGLELIKAARQSPEGKGDPGASAFPWQEGHA